METPDRPKLKEIVDALENPKYKWRTAGGVATELNRSLEDILEGLAKLVEEGAVMRSSLPAPNGEDLFTTPQHYHSFVTPIEKLGAAFRNRRS